MTTYICLNGKRTKCDNFKMGKSILIETKNGRQEFFLKRTDTYLKNTGKNYEVIQEIYLI